MWGGGLEGVEGQVDTLTAAQSTIVATAGSNKTKFNNYNKNLLKKYLYM